MPVHQFLLERLSTPTGPVLVVTDPVNKLRAVEWEDLDSRMHRLLKRHYGDGGYALSPRPDRSQAFEALADYFDGDLRAIDRVPTATNGTQFQKDVWSALRTVPTGGTASYGALAHQLGNPRGARAVGLANGSNPIPIVVPCHRVIGADSSLTGFGGGLPRKRWLLAHELGMTQEAL